MPLETYCANLACRRRFLFPDSTKGKSVRCQGCGETFIAGASSVTAPAPPRTGKSAAATSDSVGTTLGRFVIRAKLGAGAFGTVYRAFDPILDRDVALKVPNPGVMADEKRVERFLREAKAAAGLRHPNIVGVFDAGKDGDRYYIASAFIEGKPLAETIPEDGVAFARAARLVRELAEALAYAHEQGVVHRDVKPANIMVDTHDRAHLMDFGLAARQDDAARITHDGAVMGTAAYMAPEQAAGLKGEAKPASDQYSAGVVLYELLTGRTPFAGPLPVVMHNVIHTPPDSPRKHCPNVPADLETICLKAMAKRPEDRYPDCRALADDLRRWMEGDPITARQLRPWERFSRWMRKEPKLAAAVAALAVLLLVSVVLVSAYARRADTARQQAEEALADARDSGKRAEDATGAALGALGTAEEERKKAEVAEKKAAAAAARAEVAEKKAAAAAARVEVAEKKVESMEPKKVEPVEPKKVEVLNPLAGQDVVGKMETPNVIVLTRTPDPGTKWTRLDPAGKNTVRANDVVLALPGFQADVKLDTGVVASLWGNTPEQVPMRSMVMECRVRFHPPTWAFHADLTLDAGRVYLTAANPAGANVRVRIKGEVWDVYLPNPESEVLVHVSTAFVPGTPYVREGGEAPRTEARFVVTRGTADLNLPKRFTFFKLVAGTEYLWDSKDGGKPADRHPVPKDEFPTDKEPKNPDDYVKAVRRVLGKAVTDLRDGTTLQAVLKELMDDVALERVTKPKLTRVEAVQYLYPTQWAAYAQAAVIDGPDDAKQLENLIDMLRSESRPYARQAAVVALSSWVAQAPGNTDLLVKAMLDKDWLPDDAALIAHLLRGHSSVAMKDPAKLDELVGYLNHPHIAVREAALGNLLAFYGTPETFASPVLAGTDMANREVKRAGADETRLKEWDRFLSEWRKHADAIKAR